MPEPATTISGIYLFLKTHAPALFGAIFSSEHIPKNDLTTITWIITWLTTNFFGLLIVVVMSVYIGDYIELNRELTETEADVVRLGIGLFGLKLIRYINVKIEPFLNEVMDMLLDKLRSVIGVSQKGANDDK